MSFWQFSHVFNPILTYTRSTSLFAAATFLLHCVFSEQAKAIELSVFGNVGYDSVSSKPAGADPEKYVEPNPQGPTYGLGASIEPIRFLNNQLGIGLGAGLSGWSLSWATPEEGKVPAGVSISTIGLGVNGTLNYDLGNVFLYLIGSFDYGLFSSSYVTTLNGDSKNPDGLTLNNTVNSMTRIFLGVGAGYNFSGIKVGLQGGLSSVAINLSPPADSSGKQGGSADDSYAGYGVQLVVSYELLTDKKSNKADSAKSAENNKNSEKKTKTKKKKSKKKKSKKK